MRWPVALELVVEGARLGAQQVRAQLLIEEFLRPDLDGGFGLQARALQLALVIDVLPVVVVVVILRNLVDRVADLN